jgi:hypothetical protein
MIALAVFYAIENKSPAVKQIITQACDAAFTSSQFTDLSVQDLQTACVQETLASQSNSVTWTAIRAALQVSLALIAD